MPLKAKQEDEKVNKNGKQEPDKSTATNKSFRYVEFDHRQAS